MQTFTPTALESKELWEKVLTSFEVSISRGNFRTWFKDTFIQKYEEGVVQIGVPNPFARDWLVAKHSKPILKALRDIDPSVRRIEFSICKEDDRKKSEVVQAARPITASEQMRIQEVLVNSEDNLNPRYTFANFIVGSFNDMAHAAARAIVESPLGVAYNPLFVYGGTGLGKTHLLQAVGNELKTVKNKKVYYTTVEKYSMAFQEAVQRNAINQFKDRYRRYDMLIIDDVQFLHGKERTQEELFHLFNSLHDHNKHIIFSSDRAPKHIPGIDDRLRSRFEGGMIVDISKPEYESRLAILKTKLGDMQFVPSIEVLEYVASTVQDNIRELEGVLNSIVCQSQVKKRDLSLAEVKTIIKNNLKPQRSVSFNDVISTVAQFYSIDEKMLYEKTRRKEVVGPRQMVMYILREDFNISYPYIGQKLGGRDHTTVIHAYEKVKGCLKRNETLSQELEQIKLLLYNQSPS